ncbi:MAG: hypothetical protein HW399_990, partial [Dehalococcoidia bacterium]|nr:hypothetical protein [Dehalococcoidia bacterium]
NLKEWYPRGVKLPSNADREYVEELFGRTQLISLAHLHSAINKVDHPQAKEFLFFVFSGILSRANITYHIDPKHAGGGESGIFMVFRYWVPPHPDYRDVWKLFQTRARLVAAAKEKGDKFYGDFSKEQNIFQVHCDTAENLGKYVAPGTVDYIYTDPPYGAHIAYLDLSTMWHAWLGMDVAPEMRAREAIENGDQQFDEKHYLEVLQNSFEAMFKALKEDAWLSLVFHHKETNLWYNIRDMMRYIGFKYVNTVAQPLAKQTFHKVKNPLRVLGESLIVNFQKSASRKIMEPMTLPMASVIKNSAERAIYSRSGATTEEILREVVPELFEANLILDAASKNMGDILGILAEDFDQDNNGQWQIREGRKVGNFIPPKDRIKYYLINYLRREGKANFDNIVTTVLPLLVNGHRLTQQDISDVLNEIAVSYDGVHWELRERDRLQGVMPLLGERDAFEPGIPSSTHHNQQIYKLALLAEKAGLSIYIGKQERSDPMLARLKPLPHLNLQSSPEDMKRIEQIDIMWAQPDGTPLWAFEIEESTTILSALERFRALLMAAPQIGINRRLVILAPRSRRRKLQQELTSSSYIGHPLFMENKLNYMYFEDLEIGFSRLSRQFSMRAEEIRSLCQHRFLFDYTINWVKS